MSELHKELESLLIEFGEINKRTVIANIDLASDQELNALVDRQAEYWGHITERLDQIESLTKERDDFEWHYKDRVRAVALELIEKEKLEAENAKLKTYKLQTQVIEIKYEKEIAKLKKRVEELDKNPRTLRNDGNGFVERRICT